MKALLVNPNIHDFAAYDFWLKPLGLLYVGAFLKRLGFEVYLVDMMNRHDRILRKFVKVPKDKRYGTGKFPSRVIEKPKVVESIPRRFKEYGAPPEYLEWKMRKIGDVDVVMVTSTMTYWYHGVWETIRRIKEITNSPIILGGIYTQIIPHHAKKSPADFIFPTNRLEILPKFLRDNLDLNVKDLEIDWFEELDPAYELYESVGYLVFTSSIGCPFSCTYCITPRMWKFKRRTPEKVVRAILKFKDVFNVEDVVFFDDAFLVGKNHTVRLLKEIVREKINARFHLPNGIHARLVDEEIARLLREANFKTIYLGYETSGELQKKTGGKVFDEDLMRAVKFLKKAGFTKDEIKAYVLVNLPGQKLQDAVNAVNFLKELDIGISINEYTPIPGTPEWSDLVKSGMIDPDTDPLLLDNSILPYWWSGGMSKEEIEYVKSIARS